MAVSVSTGDHCGWPGSVFLDNGQLHVVIGVAAGPRILAFQRSGRENLLYASGALPAGKNAPWQLYGGHRLWAGPEHPVDTYHPDNAPVSVERLNDGVVLRAETESGTGLQKELEIRLAFDQPHAFVRQRIYNRSREDKRFCVWGLTVMRNHSRAVLPQEPFSSHADSLLPARPMALWPYTDLSDARWRIGSKYLQLQQDPSVASAQKVGVTNSLAWLASVGQGEVFVKRFEFEADGEYADFGSNCEIFCNDELLELESLGPLANCRPGEYLQSQEVWAAYGMEDSDEEQLLESRLNHTLSKIPEVQTP